MFDRSNTPYLEAFNQQFAAAWPSISGSSSKFSKFLEPVKSQYFSSSSLLAYSISKYLEIPDSISFWLEILSQNCYIFEHLHLLDDANLNILKAEYPHLPSIVKTQFHLSRSYSLQQIQWLQTWVWQTHLKILTQFPQLKHDLNQSFWQKYLLSRVSFVTSFFEDKIIMGDLLQSLGYGIGLFEIKIPVLVGFRLALDQYPKYIFTENSWHLIENFLHQISIVYSIVHQKDHVLAEFLYYHKLSDTEKNAWWLKSEIDRKYLSSNDPETIKAIKSIIAQYDQNLNNDLDNLNLPQEFLDFLVELCVWVFKPAGDLK